MIMKSFKVFFLTGIFMCSAFLAKAQVSTEPAKAEEIDPNGTLKIIVDLTQMDDSQEYVQNLQQAAADGEDLFIWTWSPAEHPFGHPLANGTADPTWKNSNDTLMMTKEAENIYSYTMVPTEFYEVDAQTVYENDIMFLVKPKDGGGFGDPDRKSDDYTIEVNPPSLERNPAYFFPGRFQENDLVVLFYDNKEEENPNLQNLDPAEAYFYAEAVLSDSSIVRIAPNSFTVGNYPELQLESFGDGIFKKYFIPNQFFDVPQNLEIASLKFFVQKKTYFSGADRISYDLDAKLSCD